MESNEPSKNTGRVVITRPVRRTRPKGRNETVSYIKYGEEWYNEVMKNKKSVIVDMLRRVAMRCDELEAAQQSVQADKSITLATCQCFKPNIRFIYELKWCHACEKPFAS
jgi:hypothetical protein